MHGSVLGFFAYGALQTKEVAGGDVLEVGALDVNGSVRPMVQARGPASYVGVDVEAGPGVDQLVDAADLLATFGPDRFDVVVSTECLEHTDDWAAAVANMAMVLRPGGVLVLTTRSPGFAFHHPPDRWRYTQPAMAEILKRLELETVALMDDPEYPGVLVKARKPLAWPAFSVAANPHQRLQGLLVRLTLDPIDGITPMATPLKWLGLPANPDGCGYYRMWQPWTQLALQSGHEVLIPPPGQHQVELNEDEVAAFDLVARQRPNGQAAVRDWRRWQGRTRLVYEADDNLLEPDPSGLPAWSDPMIRESAIACLAMSDLVTVSSEPLAEVFKPYNPHVAVLPNAIHQDLLSLPRPPRTRPLVVGWAGGATHLQDLVQVQQPLTDFLGRVPWADLHLVGMDYRPLFAHQGRWTPWQTDVWDYYRAVDFDIGLCPLADTPFNRCRTPIKALELAAMGIPVLASDVEPYRGFVVDGVTGYLCRTEGDWSRRLAELASDRDQRAELGAKARQLAQGHTIQEHWRRWAAVYEEVCA